MKNTLHKIATDLLAIKELNKTQIQILNSTYDECTQKLGTTL